MLFSEEVTLQKAIPHPEAIGNPQNPLCILSALGAVGHHNDGYPIGVQSLKETHDLPAGLCIEASCRFVCQKDKGLVNNSPGNGHAFLLSPGDLARQAAGLSRQEEKCLQEASLDEAFKNGDVKELTKWPGTLVCQTQRKGSNRNSENYWKR